MRNHYLLLISVLLFSLSSLAKEGGEHKFKIEGVYGMSSVSPSDLNTYRSTFLWNSTTASKDSFNNLTYFGGSFAFRVARFFVALGYEQQSQTLGTTTIAGAGGLTVADSFVYNPAYVLIDFPFYAKHWMFTLGAGASYAMKYEFHEKETGGNAEDITWSANPIGFRGRGSLGYMFGDHFAIFLEASYQSVSSTLKSAQAYTTTINGTAIASGQNLKNLTSGSNINVDMSGLRYGAGLRLLF